LLESKRIKEKIQRDIVKDETGFYVYWPRVNSGYLDEETVWLIAIMLTEKNAALKQQIEEYFAMQKDIESSS